MEDKELQEQIEPVIKEQLEKSRLTGVQIGWRAAYLRFEEAIKDMHSVKQIRKYAHEEANKVRSELNLKGDK